MNFGAETAPERIGQRAKEVKGERYTSLLSHVKVSLLKRAYYLLNPKAAAGVDGETWQSYGENLCRRLQDLENRIHRMGYHPPPVRRTYIPKSDGRQRPLGIPTLEDKIVQQAVRMLLEPIYEQDVFLGFSYGYRPGRSQHMALDALHEAIRCKKVNWVLDADIRSFFDTIDHGWMRKFVEHRIGDRRLVRYIVRWLKAGVMEDGQLEGSEKGTPQGGIVSPLLANIYLHYAFDLWADAWRRMHADGEVYIVRYADDIVMGFQFERDARAFRVAMAERLRGFGLELHPDKTRVIRFGRYARNDSHKDGRKKLDTFDFLGFTHYCGVNRHGKFKVGRQTSAKKLKAKYTGVREELRRRTHHRPKAVMAWLNRMLSGHYGYYGVPGNFKALDKFRHLVVYCWKRRLERRSQRARWTKRRWRAFWKRYAPVRPRITHPYPSMRFVCP
jgi:group II intron reverse transcriptase/maturase